MSQLRRLLFAALVASTLYAAPGASAAAPQPVVKGEKILDARTGGEFIPRGVITSSPGSVQRWKRLTERANSSSTHGNVRVAVADCRVLSRMEM